MKLVGKWLDGVDAETPLGDVARRALTQKLPVVFYYLPLAACHHEDSTEYVHQLRVATRCAVTAICTFAQTLPRKRSAKVMKGLKQLRKSAGRARELDVLAERFRAERDELKAAGIANKELQRLRKLLITSCAEAQPELWRGFEKQTKIGLEEKSRALGKSVAWRGDGSEPLWGKVARMLLQPHVAKVIQRSDRLDDAESLHQFRIAGKQLRYAMELTVAAFDESFRTRLYPAVRDVQQRLGEINDHVSAIAFLEELQQKQNVKGVSPQTFQTLLDRESHISRARMSEFREWWTEKRADDFRQQLLELMENAS